ncbi:hypothetical protein STAL104432_01155 [Streptomyces albus]
MFFKLVGYHRRPRAGLPYIASVWSAGASSPMRFNRAASLLGVTFIGSARMRCATFLMTTAACGCSSTLSTLPFITFRTFRNP